MYPKNKNLIKGLLNFPREYVAIIQKDINLIFLMINCFTRKFLSNHRKAYIIIKYQKIHSCDKEEVGKYIFNVISS